MRVIVEIEHSRVKVVAIWGKNFFERYWWQILVALVILAIISPFIVRDIRKRRLEHMRKALLEEKAKIEELIKRLQMSCFTQKKISVSTYKSKVSKFEKRLAEIRHTLPVIEAELKGKKYVKKRKKGVLEVKE